ncbi:MAG: diacylglycerol/lipid kinase family protein [Pirellulaceae bacterium]
MKVTLIHNPTAGANDGPNADELVAMVRAEGHEVAYQSSDEENWLAALEQPVDLIAVAGGDGTVGMVARHVQSGEIPIAVLPQGTANNLAYSLELTEIPLQQLIASWATARHLAFDLGIAKGPWGEDAFLESFGMGFFAWTLCRFDEGADQQRSEFQDPDPVVRSARQFLHERLPEFSGRSLRVRLDGRELPGDVVLLEAMNIPTIGPHLFLAPGADPGDGLLDVVLVSESERDKLAAHLHDPTTQDRAYPTFPVYRGRHLQVEGKDEEFHLDDRSWPDQVAAGRPYLIDVRVNPQALAFLVPA